MSGEDNINILATILKLNVVYINCVENFPWDIKQPIPHIVIFILTIEELRWHSKCLGWTHVHPNIPHLHFLMHCMDLNMETFKNHRDGYYVENCMERNFNLTDIFYQIHNL